MTLKNSLVVYKTVSSAENLRFLSFAQCILPCWPNECESAVIDRPFWNMIVARYFVAIDKD